ncbi:TPM domain-containing protein [Anaerocolumna sp. AGMB13020]|uniref:TPM domain-containing protein n=1 Tax=Anaerocolumna sp. AGMB13020 TaxID=3081750 RepID=UPI002955B2DD|nr:TPM domain-containing protein [Anaerocolumna sp. AGMB13020]WOO34976.1 TPM domain-containing protein [Anaerocolumna sp. AGMB13020]
MIGNNIFRLPFVKGLLLLFIALLTVTLLSPMTVMASADKTTKASAASEEESAAAETVTDAQAESGTENKKQYLFDNYGLFTEKEADSLKAACLEYSEEAKADIIMITTSTLDGKTAQNYMEDFYDEMKFGYDKEYGDTVMLLVNMEENNRWVEIQGYGQAEYYVNNDRIEYMLDDITKILKNGEYRDAFLEFAKQSAYYMNESKGVKETPASGNTNSNGSTGSGNYGESSYNGPSNYYGEKEENPLYNTVVQLVIALVIGGISVGVMAANSGGRMTAQGRTYLDEGRSGLTDHRDDYLRTTTTRVKKPTNDNNSGGRSSGGGGVSSGGHSHSGGGRSF